MGKRETSDPWWFVLVGRVDGGKGWRGVRAKKYNLLGARQTPSNMPKEYTNATSRGSEGTCETRVGRKGFEIRAVT